MNIDLGALWERAKAVRFEHRVAIIHGDLHGENVRVRGQDAIVIDLGEVRGTHDLGNGAPLCFDVAMLDVALAFQCVEERELKGAFVDEDWQAQVKDCYGFDQLQGNTALKEKRFGNWLQGCLHRIRAFGNYQQSDRLEYPIAIAIAMLRWCKFESRGQGDKGRRGMALTLGAEILEKAVSEFEGRLR